MNKRRYAGLSNVCRQSWRRYCGVPASCLSTRSRRLAIQPAASLRRDTVENLVAELSRDFLPVFEIPNEGNYPGWFEDSRKLDSGFFIIRAPMESLRRNLVVSRKLISPCNHRTDLSNYNKICPTIFDVGRVECPLRDSDTIIVYGFRKYLPHTLTRLERLELIQGV